VVGTGAPVLESMKAGVPLVAVPLWINGATSLHPPNETARMVVVSVA
jgi:hypothetical protein